MPKVDLDSIEQVNRTGYPPPFNEADLLYSGGSLAL